MFGEFARWVWLSKDIKEDEYCSFKQTFESSQGKMLLKICAETNYIAYVNGKRVAFGQFPNYVKEKYYDEIDISEQVKKGENELIVDVWYEGKNTATHIKGRGGVIFCVSENGKSVTVSGEDKTLAGLHTGYMQYRQKTITIQLGLSSGMIGGNKPISYGKSVEVDLSYNFLPRPVKKLEEKEVVYGKRLDIKNREIYDLGRETAGYILLEVESEQETNLLLSYGEHIVDGGVRRLVGGRDFSFDFTCVKGKNYFEQLFVRFAGRYIEIEKNDLVKVVKVGVIPVFYPVEEKEKFLSGQDGKIYDVCVDTLKLCMHEHYEDCPWREQALYVLDSRNQMLCGYYAFKETAFQRANIVFISKGQREDGLLELTYPAVETPAIPFFSVMYPVTVYEYVEHTKDETVLKEVMGTAIAIMSKMKERITDNGLIDSLPSPYWNFYEWTDGSSGGSSSGDYDLILNCAFLYSYKRFKKLCQKTGARFEIDEEKMKDAIVKTFYDEGKGMYFLSTMGERKYSQLGNAFAKLVGLSGKNVISAIKGEGVILATLSMLGYVYDALLEEGDEDFVLQDIRSKYGYMLEQGATSFWETILGEKDFDNAGSLCHGWSAMPVYYFNKLLGDKK